LILSITVDEAITMIEIAVPAMGKEASITGMTTGMDTMGTEDRIDRIITGSGSFQPLGHSIGIDRRSSSRITSLRPDNCSGIRRKGMREWSLSQQIRGLQTTGAQMKSLKEAQPNDTARKNLDTRKTASPSSQDMESHELRTRRLDRLMSEYNDCFPGFLSATIALMQDDEEFAADRPTTPGDVKER
jgi:hypothetical protein